MQNSINFYFLSHFRVTANGFSSGIQYTLVLKTGHFFSISSCITIGINIELKKPYKMRTANSRAHLQGSEAKTLLDPL